MFTALSLSMMTVVVVSLYMVTMVVLVEIIKCHKGKEL